VLIVEALEDENELNLNCGLEDEWIYLFEYATLPALQGSLEEWFGRYNHWRPHEKTRQPDSRRRLSGNARNS